jgi:hypothetical protein
MRANASVGLRQAETYDRRSFGESVTFEDFTPEARTKGNTKIGWKLFSTANNSAQRAESVARDTLEVLAQKSWRGQEHRGRICARSLRELVAVEWRRRSIAARLGKAGRGKAAKTWHGAALLLETDGAQQFLERLNLPAIIL